MPPPSPEPASPRDVQPGGLAPAARPNTDLVGPPRPIMSLLVELGRWCGSLRLAVVLLTLLTVLLAWATVVEAQYGTEAVQFGIYGTWWFGLLNLLLGVNVLGAMLSRLPWRRKHTGFLVTHLGIIVLLVGCAVSLFYGTAGHLFLEEGATDRSVFGDGRTLELAIFTPEGEPLGKSVAIPVALGPFNWEDYNERLFPFPWWLAQRTRGTVYDADGVRIELLDHLSNSQREALPRLTLRLGSPDDQSQLGEKITLAVKGMPQGHGMSLHSGLGQCEIGKLGHRVVFWMTDSEAETQAFRQSKPAGDIGPLGQVVLFHKGQAYALNIADFQGKPHLPLGDSGLRVQLLARNPAMPGRARTRLPSVQLAILGDEGQAGRMTLYAVLPHLNRHDPSHAVYGSYWIDPSQQDEDDAEPLSQETLRDASMPRIDLLQGADQRLYARTWLAPRFEGSFEIDPALDDSRILFAGTDDAVRLSLDQFLPSPKPDWRIVPVPFSNKGDKQRRVHLRVKVDGNEDTFWLAEQGAMRLPDQMKIAGSEKRVARLRLLQDRTELGFQVRLNDFKVQLDPGSSRPAGYTSLVDFLKPDGQPLREDVTIELNHPVDFSDPSNGRSYRLFQSSWRPSRTDDEGKRTGMVSIFSVSYDPGRSLKYLGSILICAGIVVMYYMKVYLFRKKSGVGELGS